MIKSIPGWLNFFLLLWFYAVVIGGHILLLRMLLRWDETLFWVAIALILYAGAYMAKWRFYPKDVEGNWRFW